MQYIPVLALNQQIVKHFSRGFGRDASPYFILLLLQLAFLIHLSNPQKTHILIIIFVFCKPTFIPLSDKNVEYNTFLLDPSLWRPATIFLKSLRIRYIY